MELATFYYKDGQGWSVKDFPKLDSENSLVLVFFAPEFINNQEPFKQLVEHYPNSKIVGCSSAGEIAGAYIFDKSISVAVARFENTKIAIAMTESKDAKESELAGENIAAALKKNDLKAILVLSEGLNVNGTALVRGLNKIGTEDVVVTGGLAGDGDRFKKTWVMHSGKVYSDAIVGIGFYGDKVRIGHGSKGGWDIFGIERVITRAKDNVLYELDNKPALALYKEYLGDMASGLPAAGLVYPLAIRKNEQDSKPLVRTILAVNEENQSLTFAGDMPEGFLAQLMHANFDRLIVGASDAGRLADELLKQKNQKMEGPILAIAISCVGRRLVLGDRTEEETESTLAALPENTQQVGFYSYGELSPFAMGNCDLHNQTMTLTIIYEE